MSLGYPWARLLIQIEGAAQPHHGAEKLKLRSLLYFYPDPLLSTVPDTRLRLGADARLKIDRYVANAGGEFSLLEGGLLYDRPRRQQSAESLLRSLFGLIAIRGTHVFAGPSNGVFGVFVARGSVDVMAAGKTVTLRSGFGTNIAKPGDPPTDPARWKRPRIAAAFASVN